MNYIYITIITHLTLIYLFLKCTGMHRKSMEVAQHYSESEGKLIDTVVSSSGEGGRGSNEDGSKPDSSSSSAASAAAHHHHQQQRAQQQLQQQLHNLSNAQQNSLFDVATAAALGVDHSEDFRSNSIASLRAKAQQHSAQLIQSAYTTSSNLENHLQAPPQHHHHNSHSHHSNLDARNPKPLQVTL